MTYYIYHIPGVKYGCTTEPKTRYKDRDITDLVIESYDEIEVADKRERELNDAAGYKHQHESYIVARAKRLKGGINGGKITGRQNLKKVNLSEAGKKGGLVSGHKYGAINGTRSCKKEYICPACGKVGHGPRFASHIKKLTCQNGK
jgi:hypothetical protein